jgi:hypothetical protein
MTSFKIKYTTKFKKLILFKVYEAKQSILCEIFSCREISSENIHFAKNKKTGTLAVFLK